MKKLFAALLVGTLAVAGQMAVFAATGEQSLASEIKGVETVATIEAINLEDLTPAQKAEMEKNQKDFENKVKEVCKKAGYNFKDIMEKLEKGTLTEKEQAMLVEAGILMNAEVVGVASIIDGEEVMGLHNVDMQKDIIETNVVKSVAAISIEDLTPAQKAEMEKTQKEFKNSIKEACKKAGYDFDVMMKHFNEGELTNKERSILEKAGIMMAVTTESVATVELEMPVQK